MSFAQEILKNSALHPKQPTIIEVHENKNLSFSSQNLLRNVASCQKALEDYGIKKTSRVCILGPNSFEWVTLDLSIISLGGISIPLYHRQEIHEIQHILTDAKPELLIYFDKNLLEKIKSNTNLDFPCVQACEFFKNASKNLEVAYPQVDPYDTATIIYTSGTSGQPKGVMLSNQNIDFMLTQTKQRLFLAKGGCEKEDIVFHFLPLCFAGSRIMLWTQLIRQNKVHLSTNLKNLSSEIQKTNPNYYLNVPAVLERIKNGVEEKITTEQSPLIQKLYQNGKRIYQKIISGKASFWEKIKFNMIKMLILQKIKNRIGSNLDFLICGSAPLHTETQFWFEMIGIRVYQVYGLTETTGIITMDTPSLQRSGWVGTPIEEISISITQDGELTTKGPHIFQGYFEKPDQTQEVLQNGWFHTGDLVEMDDQNRLKILGRKKNVIIPSSGHNIMPEPLEEQLCQMDPTIEHACIVGHGQTKVGVVVSGQTNENTIKDIIEKFNQTQPHYKKMAFFILSKESFSQENGLLTMNQKLKRNAIETSFKDQIQNKIREIS